MEREKVEREKVERDKQERAKREADQREAENKKQASSAAAEARERQTARGRCTEGASGAGTACARRTAESRRRGGRRTPAEADYIRRIQAKIKGNVVLPPDLPGNPEAIFDVVQLPTGEIIDAALRKSSGVRAYDDAVQRAIVKSSTVAAPRSPGPLSPDVHAQVPAAGLGPVHRP